MKTIKNKITITVLFIFFCAPGLFAQQPDSHENLKLYRDSIASMQLFERELTSKGEWIKIDSNQIDAEAIEADPSQNENAGLDEDLNKDVIWRPNGVEADWNPYSYGIWRYTSSGWMWISYYDFGWTTCHYGRWWWSPVYGWVWSPGYIWAPAWTSWCYNEDYIGWEPLSPRVHHRHHHGEHGEHHEYYPVSGVHTFHERWTIVGKRDFDKSITKKIVLAPDQNYAIVTKAKIVNDVTISPGGRVTNVGPNITDIEKETGRKVSTVNVEKFNKNNKKYVKDDNAVIDKKVKEFNNTGDATKHEVSKTTDGTKKTDEGNTGIKKTEEKTTEKKKVDEAVKKENEGVKKSDDNGNKWKPKEYTPPTKREDPPKQKEQPKQYTPPPTKNEDSPKQKEEPKQYTPPPVKHEDPPQQKEQPKQNTDEPKKNDTKKGDN